MDIILIGGFLETIELCEDNNINIVGIVDNKFSDKTDYPYLGNDNEFLLKKEKFIKYPILVTPDKPSLRVSIYKNYIDLGFKPATVISKDSYISKSAIIKEGIFIQRGVNISSSVAINQFARININANIMHDSIVGLGTTICPNAVILGHVYIGELCYIGSNATILPKICIENNSIIGAGSVVTKNILENSIVKGVPAK